MHAGRAGQAEMCLLLATQAGTTASAQHWRCMYAFVTDWRFGLVAIGMGTIFRLGSKNW